MARPPLHRLTRIAILLLTLTLLGTGVASFFGVGITTLTPTSDRAGSLYGPAVIGGGPRAGK